MHPHPCMGVESLLRIGVLECVYTPFPSARDSIYIGGVIDAKQAWLVSSLSISGLMIGLHVSFHTGTPSFFPLYDKRKRAFVRSLS